MVNGLLGQPKAYIFFLYKIYLFYIFFILFGFSEMFRGSTVTWLLVSLKGFTPFRDWVAPIRVDRVIDWTCLVLTPFCFTRTVPYFSINTSTPLVFQFIQFQKHKSTLHSAYWLVPHKERISIVLVRCTHYYSAVIVCDRLLYLGKQTSSDRSTVARAQICFKEIVFNASLSLLIQFLSTIL